MKWNSIKQYLCESECWNKSFSAYFHPVRFNAKFNMNKQDFSVCVILPTRDCSTEKKSNFSLRSVLFVTQSSVLQNITRTVTSPEIRRYMTTFLNFFATFISRFQHQIKLKLRLENSTIKKKMQCLVFCFLFVHISHEFVRMIWEYPSQPLWPGAWCSHWGLWPCSCSLCRCRSREDSWQDSCPRPTPANWLSPSSNVPPRVLSEVQCDPALPAGN